MRRGIVLITAFIFLLSAGVSARGETGFGTLGKQGPGAGAEKIDISSKRLHVKYPKGLIEATYEGNVRVKQGDVTMSCDRLVIVYQVKDAKTGQDLRDPKLAKDAQTISNMKSITAMGNVKLVQGDRLATGGKAVFDNVKRTITLEDNPRLWQGADRLVADKIVFYLDESRSEAFAGKDKEINVSISPGKHKEQEKSPQ